MSKSPTVPKSVARARSTSSVQGSAIESLTAFLLLEIFSHIRSVKGLATCSLVCRKWHALTWTYALEMDLSSFQNGTNQVLPVNDTKLVYLSALSPSVRHLNLSHCVSITDEGVSALIGLSNLRTLLLHGCRLLTDKSLQDISKMARLEEVDISGLNSFSSAGIRSLGRAQQLQSVTLYGIDSVDDRVLESLAKLVSLRHLDISSCVSVTEDGIRHIGRATTLTSLNLSGNSRLGQQRAWKHLDKLQNLTQLKVKSIIFSDDQMDDFCDILPYWSKLSELRLGFCQIRDQHCPAFGKLPLLQTLSIHNATSLKPESYTYFSKVTDLDLSRSTVPVHALEHMPHLIRLELKNAKLSSVSELRVRHTHSSKRSPLASSSGISSLSASSSTIASANATIDYSSSPSTPWSPSSPEADGPIASPRRLLSSASPFSYGGDLDRAESSNGTLGSTPPISPRHKHAYPASPSAAASSSSEAISPPTRKKRRKSQIPSPTEASPSTSPGSPARTPPLLIGSPTRNHHHHNHLSRSNGGLASPPSSPPSRSPKSEFSEVRSLSSLHSIPSLRRLSLRVENMTDKDIGHVSKCKKLRELDLMWLSQVTSKGLQKLGRLRLLQSLNLTNCKSLTDETLQTILPNLKFLKALSLAHCTLVGDPGLLAIASSSLQLHYLILFQLPLLTNEGITSLVTLNDLELLEISGCHHIDVPYCQALLKEFLPGLHLNHSAQSRESSSSSAHCVIS